MERGGDARAAYPAGVRRRAVLIGLATALVLAGAVGAYAWQQRGPAPAVDPVRIGTGPEQETRLVATILAELLAVEDIPSEISRFSSTGDAREGLELGTVDVLPSYTGAVWLEEFGFPNPPRDGKESYERVKELDADDGLIWLPRTGVNATFAFVVRGPPGEWAHLQRVFDLSVLNSQPDEKLCVERSFADRSDGLQALVPRVVPLDREVLTDQILEATPEQAVAAVAAGDCLAGLTTATAGGAWVNGLKVLRDERQAFPAFVLATVVTESLVEERPEAVAALRRFDGRVDDEQLRVWNGRVLLGEDVQTVAADAASTLLPEEDPAG